MKPERLLYGHRGAASERPENTLTSFERALEVGADVLETDVHVTADGHFVLSHDATGARMAGAPARIRDTNLSDLAQWDAGWGFVDEDGRRPFAGRGHRIPTLERALAAFPDAFFNVDIKDASPRVASRLVTLLRLIGAEERVRLVSFHEVAIAPVRARGYRGGTALSRVEAALLLTLPAALRLLPCAGMAAQIPHRTRRRNLGQRKIADACHRAGVRLDYWTVNDPERAAELLASGADGIITDDPASIRPVFDRREGRWDRAR